MKWFFSALMLILAGYYFGARFHPENLRKYFEHDDQRGYVEILLTSGNLLAGRKVAETSGDLTVQIGKGTTVLRRNEIVRVHELDPAEVRSGRYDGMMFRERAESRLLVTMRYEDSLFAMIEKMADHIFSNAAGKLSGTGESAFNMKQMVADAVKNAVPASAGSGGAASALPDLSAMEAGPANSGLSSLMQGKEAGGGQDYSALMSAGLTQLKKQRA